MFFNELVSEDIHYQEIHAKVSSADKTGSSKPESLKFAGRFSFGHLIEVKFECHLLH